MGCTPSAPSSDPDGLVELFGPPPPIPVDIGSGIHHQLNNDVIIVFIFGGPASNKGLIIQELTSCFNFVSLSVEDIVFNYLPSRVGNNVDSIGEIQDILKRDREILTVDWILSMISAKLSTSMNQRFVIDIIPTLSTILKAESYSSRSHEKSLESFERRHPITFALDVNVIDEQNLLNPNNESNGKEADGKKLSPEMNQFMKGIDDIDKGRLEKRLDEYHHCSDPFLRYFNKSRRIVRLSLCTTAFSNLVSTVRDVLLDFGFTITRKTDQVIVFTTDVTPEDIDLTYYKMKIVQASDLCRAGDNLNDQISAVYKHISSLSKKRADDNYLVVVPNFRNQGVVKWKRINFMEKMKSVYLDEFIRNKQHDKPPKSRSRLAVNCISSSRHIFLFLEPFPANLAQSIALMYTKLNLRHRVAVDKLASRQLLRSRRFMRIMMFFLEQYHQKKISQAVRIHWEILGNKPDPCQLNPSFLVVPLGSVININNASAIIFKSITEAVVAPFLFSSANQSASVHLDMNTVYMKLLSVII